MKHTLFAIALFTGTIMLTLWGFMLYYLVVQPCVSPMFYALYYALVSSVALTALQVVFGIWSSNAMVFYFKWVHGIMMFGNMVLYSVLIGGYAGDCRDTGVYTVSALLLALYVCGLIVWTQGMVSLLQYDASVRMYGSRQSGVQ